MAVWSPSAIAAAGPDTATVAQAEVIDVISDIVPEQLQDRAADVGGGVTTDAVGNITYTVDSPVDGDVLTPDFSTQATVSLDPAIGARIVEVGKPEQAITMQLDSGHETSAGTVVASDAVAFETAGDTKTLVLVKEDASVQFLTTIPGPQDPEEFVFNVGLPPGAVAEYAADGGIRFVNGDGVFLGGVLPPWARDAAGRDLTTRYQFAGGKLTQFVKHSGVQGVPYPIVADPWLGKAIWGSTSLSPLSGCAYQGSTLVCSRYTINLTLTQWGFNSGTLVLNDAGWDEARAKQPRITRYTTSKDQYNCHALGYFPDREYNWNLEENRSATRDTGLWIRTSCNW